VGPDGALWFTEFYGNNIGRITMAGVITEYAVPTAFAGPSGITAGPDGALWFTEDGSNKIARITTAGVITEYVVPQPPLGTPYLSGITAGPDGALWFTDVGGVGNIGRITTAGVIKEYAPPSSASQPSGITLGPDGALWFAESRSNNIGRLSIGGNTVTITAISPSTAVAGGPAFTLFVNGTGFSSGATVLWNGAALPTGVLSSIQLTAPVPSNLIGSAGTATVAVISGGITSAGVPFIANATGQRNIITTVAGSGSFGFGTGGYSGDSGPATLATLSGPRGVAVDASGNLFIADTGNSRIRKVAPGGMITTIVGDGTQGTQGDGGPATSAHLYVPTSVAVDTSGNLFISDLNANVIRKVSASGIITAVAGGVVGGLGDGGLATSAELDFPAGIAVDVSGNLFIADSSHNRIRKVSASGIITTVAGNGEQGFSGDDGSATLAQLHNPEGVAVDAFGNLFIADTSNSRVRKVSANGIIMTIAGNGNQFTSGDGGPATSEYLSAPVGVTVDALGNLFITDIGNNRVRKVSVSGTITTVAGSASTSQGGFSGDGGPATSALLSSPTGVAVDASGNVFIADSGNNRIREVSGAASAAAPAPSITSGGIVPLYSTVNTIQPGEWVSIYGTNLASSTVSWNGDFPTSLGGTSVTINGKAAYFSYVSPTQINLQVPNDTTIGSVPVVVTTAGGKATSTVTLAQFAPSLLLLDSKHIAGIIVRSNGTGAYAAGAYDIIGPTGNSLGYATVAAKAGDTIELFGTGLGPTNPAVPAGQTFSGAAQTTSPVTLRINNVSVTPAFVGLTGAGLYQINLTVPAGLGAGDVSLQAGVGGVQTSSGVVISLQ